MFISTREMLNQVGGRAADEALIEEQLGPLRDTAALLTRPAVQEVLHDLGAEALSDKALRMLARALEQAAKRGAETRRAA